MVLAHLPSIRLLGGSFRLCKSTIEDFTLHLIAWNGRARFPLQRYRSETWRISLFREHAGRTNDINTIEYATFRCDTVEVENGLKPTQKSTVHDLAS